MRSKERRELIDMCQQLKRSLPSSRSMAATGGATLDDKTKNLITEYRTLKQQVRDSCAAQIQAIWRGYRTRKPVSCALADYSTNRVAVTVQRIREARRKEGRPPEMEDMNLQQLKEEKHNIKLILVGYDRAFRRKHGRLPTKQEKEQFRPIYQIYNKAKSLLNAHPEAKTATPRRPDSLEARIAAVKKEKRTLQIKVRGPPHGVVADDRLMPGRQLNRFEQNFRKQNGRHIMWESDITPVRADYERYKVRECANVTADTDTSLTDCDRA